MNTFDATPFIEKLMQFRTAYYEDQQTLEIECIEHFLKEFCNWVDYGYPELPSDTPNSDYYDYPDEG